MTSRDLFEAIGLLDDTLILAADAPPARPRLRVWRRVLPLAACLCLIVGGGLLAWRSGTLMPATIEENAAMTADAAAPVLSDAAPKSNDAAAGGAEVLENSTSSQASAAADNGAGIAAAALAALPTPDLTALEGATVCLTLTPDADGSYQPDASLFVPGAVLLLADAAGGPLGSDAAMTASFAAEDGSDILVEIGVMDAAGALTALARSTGDDWQGALDPDGTGQAVCFYLANLGGGNVSARATVG